MSKKEGDYYGCDESLAIKRSEARIVNKDQYYYVAPIITDEKFDLDLLQLYSTPTKNPGQGAMTTRSRAAVMGLRYPGVRSGSGDQEIQGMSGS